MIVLYSLGISLPMSFPHHLEPVKCQEPLQIAPLQAKKLYLPQHVNITYRKSMTNSGQAQVNQAPAGT